MHILLLKSCAYIAILSIWLPVTYALLTNESFLCDLPNDVEVRDMNQPVLNTRNRVETKQITTNDEEESDRNEMKEKEREMNCTDRSIDDFPKDLFTHEERRHGAVLLHVFLGLYCFLLTAFVCHDYLIPAVDRICVSMNISTDVAGATFLAMTSSFPELFVNVIGTFLTESDLGLGTVVGSAVFDTFATPACGALTAYSAISLEWRILSRDCTMYVISVGTLVAIMWDQRIEWYEAMILLILFCIYLILLFCGKGIRLCCGTILPSNSESTTEFSNVDEKLPRNGSYKLRALNVVSTNSNLESQQQGGIGDFKSTEKLESRSVSEYLFTWPRERTMIAKCWFLFCWPLKFLLCVTIPDARTERLKHWYPLTFIMCLIWVGISSYLVSWMTTVVGDTIGIPDSIMGLTFLAAGGNMPEIASIVILARQGDGNMAMSNTLGANILDILLCLGLPWMIKCLMRGKDVEIVSGSISYSVLSTIVCIVILYVVIACFNFKLNKQVGIICLLVYSVFLIFAILVEMNVFYVANLPICNDVN